MITQLQDLVEQIFGELPSILAVAIVTVDDGLTIAETSGEEGQSSVAAAYLASIVKSSSRAIVLFGDDEVVDDILVSTTNHHFVVRHSPDQPFFLFVMTTSDDWLGRTRSMLKSYEPEVMKFDQFLREQIV
ncbi:MAG: roadblock/LC7 domain-containing protein [Desulfotalea sp.]